MEDCNIQVEETKKFPEEGYVEKYAKARGISVEEAKSHEIVKEWMRNYGHEDQR